MNREDEIRSQIDRYGLPIRADLEFLLAENQRLKAGWEASSAGHDITAGIARDAMKRIGELAAENDHLTAENGLMESSLRQLIRGGYIEQAVGTLMEVEELRAARSSSKGGEK